MLKFLAENQGLTIQLLELLGALLGSLLVWAVLRGARLLGLRADDQRVRQAVEIARTVAAAAEEWGHSQVKGGAGKPDGSQKLLHAVELAKQMATGAMKKWGEEQWATYIQSQVPDLRARLSVPPAPITISIPPAAAQLPPIPPDLRQYTEPR